MKSVVQRVDSASVTVEDETIAATGPGMLVLIGAEQGDSESDAITTADKVVGLRIFKDDDGKMNRSIADVEGEVLVVSQFTLAGDVRKGRRPSFVRALDPVAADQLVKLVAERIQDAGVSVRQGRFGAEMNVALVNAGPVTIILTTREGKIV